MSLKIAAAVLCAASIVMLRAPAARADAILNATGFGGSNELQTWVAQDRGFFKKEGLVVHFDATKGSVAETRDLFAGKYQVMSSAFDNIVADIEGQGEEKWPNASDLVAFMGVNSGFETLVSAPQIAKASDLRGKTVAVDAARSGYAIVMYRLLQQAGLTMGKDYSVLAVGGTSLRVKALADGKAMAAMVSTPLDAELAAKGYHILAKSSEVGPYQGSAYVTLRSWADRRPPELSGYIRAIVAATRYIYENKAGAIDVLKKHEPKLDPSQLDALYAELTGPGGFDPHASIDMAGVKTVIALRGEYGLPKKKLDAPGKYIVEDYYRRALAK
jgi:ABC-type nitrate/sulfonate/bicarbonate transport system substrate-binding protein